MDNLSYEQQSLIIKKTLKELKKNELEVGKKIYEFVLTKEISMSVLFINSQIEKQAILFMKMLEIVVGYLDDQHSMDEKLLEIGIIHIKKYGVRNEHYKHFRTAFMKAIKLYIPWNDRREKTWFWFWDHVIQIMSIAAQKKLEKEIMSYGISSQTLTEYMLAIHESYETTIESSTVFGNALYRDLLNEQCEIANLFSHKQQEFEFQSARFVATLGHVIRLLEDQEAFQNKIISLSYQYRNYGISVAQVKLFGDVFVKTLKSMNNDLWIPIHDKSWEWLWDILAKLYQIGSQK